MADDSLEFAANETALKTKLNRKLAFVGKGSQINALLVTYPGQKAYSILTENNFVKDKLYMRNAANSSWTGNMTESAEQSSTSAFDGLLQFPGTTKSYHYFTLPTTEKFYVITGIEWNDAGDGPTISAGVDAVNANPPTIDHTVLLAKARTVAGIGTYQRISDIASKIIRGGTICGAWISLHSTGLRMYGNSSSNAKYQQGVVYSNTPNFANADAFTNTTSRLYIKVYYRGWS